MNEDLPSDLAALVIATKPQILDKVLPALTELGGGSSVVISIAAGAPTALFEAYFGARTPVVRVMANLPAAVGAGASALFANDAVDAQHLKLVQKLFEAVGSVVALPEEDLLHVVTGLSGSVPAYVFAMSEALAQAGIRCGIPADLAKVLAAQTIAEAGSMLMQSGADANHLRRAVTSKGETTAAGLGQLIAEGGLGNLMQRTVEAARLRSIELSS